MKKIQINTDYIKLDSFLKFCGEAETGGMAKEMILDSQVKVNGQICNVRGKKLYSGDTVQIFDSTYEVTD